MKKYFIFAHLVLLTLAAWQGAGLIFSLMDTVPGKPGKGIPNVNQPSTQAGPLTKKTTPAQKQAAIIARNIFKVDVTAPGPGQPVSKTKLPPLKKTDLRLSLWGTVIGDRTMMAVIEDKKTRKQALYEPGDRLEGAVIKEIYQDRVILSLNGQDQVLMAEQPRTRQNNNAIAPAAQMLPKSTPSSPINTPPLALLSQARVRTLFRNGEPKGLIVYGIKTDSVFEKLGLKNGDVVLEIDGTPTRTARDARTIYTKLATPSDTRVTIQRRGKTLEFIYNFKNNQFTVEEVAK